MLLSHRLYVIPCQSSLERCVDIVELFTFSIKDAFHATKKHWKSQESTRLLSECEQQDALETEAASRTIDYLTNMLMGSSNDSGHKGVFSDFFTALRLTQQWLKSNDISLFTVSKGSQDIKKQSVLFSESRMRLLVQMSESLFQRFFEIDQKKDGTYNFEEDLKAVIERAGLLPADVFPLSCLTPKGMEHCGAACRIASTAVKCPAIAAYLHRPSLPRIGEYGASALRTESETALLITAILSPDVLLQQYRYITSLLRLCTSALITYLLHCKWLVSSQNGQNRHFISKGFSVVDNQSALRERLTHFRSTCDYQIKEENAAQKNSVSLSKISSLKSETERDFHKKRMSELKAQIRTEIEAVNSLRALRPLWRLADEECSERTTIARASEEGYLQLRHMLAEGERDIRMQARRLQEWELTVANRRAQMDVESTGRKVNALRREVELAQKLRLQEEALLANAQHELSRRRREIEEEEVIERKRVAELERVRAEFAAQKARSAQIQDVEDSCALRKLLLQMLRCAKEYLPDEEVMGNDGFTADLEDELQNLKMKDDVEYRRENAQLERKRLLDSITGFSERMRTTRMEGVNLFSQDALDFNVEGPKMRGCFSKVGTVFSLLRKRNSHKHFFSDENHARNRVERAEKHEIHSILKAQQVCKEEIMKQEECRSLLSRLQQQIGNLSTTVSSPFAFSKLRNLPNSLVITKG